MLFSKLMDEKNKAKYEPENIIKRLYKGACVKIKNSNKTFQVIGLNPESKICWIREWPLNLEDKKTFYLEINQITLQTYCSNQLIKD